MQIGYFNTLDDAHIYYEIHGKGAPLLFVHGWQCSHVFWQKNVDVLAENFNVITFDLRGHGNSSKGLHGITIKQYAKDVYDLIEYLGLEDVVLMGWSLGGPTVLSYYKQFASQHLKGLGLIDMTPFPFSPEPWNTQGLHGYNMDGFNAQVNTLIDNRQGFYEALGNNIFRNGVMPKGAEWTIDEFKKLPPWISAAIYSDYLSSDYTGVLPTITIPTLVVNANSCVFADGIKQGKHVAAQIPNAEFVPFTESGHMLFYEEPDKFNKIVTDFMVKCAE